MRSSVEIVAHRGGGSGLVQPETPPENTLPAFTYGWEHADSCELDCHLTADGRLIVIHDADTSRTTDGTLVVAEHTLSELQRLDAGEWKGARWRGTRLPSLEVVLDTIPEGSDRRLFIELKCGPKGVPELARVLKSSGLPAEQCVVISFNRDSIVAARQALPQHETYLLSGFEYVESEGKWFSKQTSGPDSRQVTSAADSEGVRSMIDWVAESGLTGIDLSYRHPPGLLSELKTRGLKAAVWTVNSVEDVQALIRLGVDSITTDVPEAMKLGDI